MKMIKLQLILVLEKDCSESLCERKGEEGIYWRSTIEIAVSCEAYAMLYYVMLRCAMLRYAVL